MGHCSYRTYGNVFSRPAVFTLPWPTESIRSIFSTTDALLAGLVVAREEGMSTEETIRFATASAWECSTTWKGNQEQAGGGESLCPLWNWSICHKSHGAVGNVCAPFVRNKRETEGGILHGPQKYTESPGCLPYNHGQHRFKEQLLLITYEIGIRSCRAAEALSLLPILRANHHLQKAQDVLRELMVTLNVERRRSCRRAHEALRLHVSPSG